MSSELKVHQTMSAATSYPCSTSQSEENTMERDDFDEFDLSNLCDDEPWTERWQCGQNDNHIRLTLRMVWYQSAERVQSLEDVGVSGRKAVG